MTVSTTTRKQTYNMDGATLTFDFTFRALTTAPTDIKCKHITVATGAESADLTYTTDYTVSINSNGIGGTVTVTDAKSSAFQLLVYRDTTDTQESDYSDFDQFPADTLERDLDKRTMIAQEQSEEQDRIVKYPISSTVGTITFPNPVADQYIGWNSDGDDLENKNTQSLGTIVLDTDGTLAANSDAKVASQKATKTYVDANAGNVTASASIGTNKIVVGSSGTTTIKETQVTVDASGNIGSVGTITMNGGINNADGDIYNVAWTDYSSSSTVTGWSSFTNKKIFYKKIGNLIFFMFQLSGTSNSTAVSFTLPYAMTGDLQLQMLLGTATDTSSTITANNAYFFIQTNGSTVYCYPNAVGSNWSAAGDKALKGQGFYESNT